MSRLLKNNRYKHTQINIIPDSKIVSLLYDYLGKGDIINESTILIKSLIYAQCTIILA